MRGYFIFNKKKVLPPVVLPPDIPEDPPPPDPEEPAPPVYYPKSLGVCGHPYLNQDYSGSYDYQFTLMNQMGFTDYRFYVPISGSGTLSIDNENKLKDIVIKAAAKNIKLFPLLPKAIDYAKTTGENETYGFNMGAAFATIWLSYFPLKTFEIGNEVDKDVITTGDGSILGNYNSAKISRASSYIRGFANGLRSVDPAIKIVINAGWKHWGFVQKLITDGLVINIIAWHWYSTMEDNFPEQIAEKLIELFPGKEIWFNEINSQSTDEATQRNWVVDFLVYVSAFPEVSKKFIYELFNQPNREAAERNFGMFVYNGNNDANAKLLATYFINKQLFDALKPDVVNNIKPYVKAVFSEPAYLVDTEDVSFGLPRLTRRINGPESPSTDNSYVRIYSKQQKWNVGQSFLKIGGRDLHDGNTGQFIKSLATPGSSVTIWSNIYADKLFVFGNNKIQTINPNTGVINSTPIFTFTRADGWDRVGSAKVHDPASDGVVSVGEGEGNIDDNDKYVVLRMYKNAVAYNVLFDLQLGSIVWSKTDAQIGFSTDWIGVSKSGNYIVCNNIGVGKLVYTREFVPVMFNKAHVNLGQRSHMDFARDASGSECMTTMGNAGFVDLLTGKYTSVISDNQIQNSFVSGSGHSSGTGPDGWGLYSFSGTTAVNPYIVYAKLDGSKTYRIFAHSRRGGNQYPSETKASISRDGNIIIYISDMNQANVGKERIYLTRMKPLI